jgi:hypothetical protein
MEQSSLQEERGNLLPKFFVVSNVGHVPMTVSPMLEI